MKFCTEEWHRLPEEVHAHLAPPPDWLKRRRRLFSRLMIVFLLWLLVNVGGMVGMVVVFQHFMGLPGSAPLLAWIGSLLAALILPVVILIAGVRAFRGVAVPLADVMAAAESVAAGDLSVRVPVRGPREFARVAEAFNRMAAGLQLADQQRRNLTADVAHELRTPLQIIQGNLEGILDGIYQATPEHIEATLEEAQLLARLVEDLRMLSQAEAGQLTLVREPVAVSDLLADVSTSFSGQAEVNGVDLVVESPEYLWVQGDAGRLEQVLNNLVTNALRHTPAGGRIVLRAERGGLGVQISVEDTGVGIAVEDLPFVFDRFWRGDRSRKHSEGTGSGLGLAIARQLVQAHGGRIRVTSTIGKGSTFVVELPLMEDR